MNSNITGSSSDPFASTSTTNGLTPTTGDTATAPQTAPPRTKPSTAVPTDFQVFEGTDFLDIGNIVTQQFPAAQRWGKDAYQAASQQPILQLPVPEGGAALQDFEEPAWRYTVNKSFRNHVKGILTQNAKETGGNVTPDQIEVKFNNIIQNVVSGKVGDLSKEDQAVVTKATEAAQVAAPLNVDVARREILARNINELLNDIDKAGQKVADSLLPDDPKRLAVGDLIRIIAQAIRGLKDAIRELELQDAEIQDKVSKAKYEQIEDRKQELEDTANKIADAAEQRRKQEQMSKIMKIVAPVISALVILAGVIALPFTAGASTALIVAGIVIASVMLAYTILDSVFDLTSKAVTAFKDMVDKAFPGEDNAWKRTLVKITAIVVLATFLAVAIAATGGTAAGSVAAQVATQVAKELTIQFTIMFIMASNILPELAVEGLINSGVINKNDEKAKLAAQMVVMALTMVLTTVAVAKGQKPLRSIGAALKDGVQAIGQGIQNVGNAITRIAQAYAARGLQAAINELNEMLKALLQIIINLMKSAGNQIANQLTPAFDAVSKSIKDLRELISSPAFKKALQDALTAENALKQLAILRTNLINAGQVFIDQILAFTKETTDRLVEAAKTARDSIIAAANTIEKPDFKAIALGLRDIFDTNAIKKGDLEKIALNVQDALKILGLGVDIGGSVYIAIVGLELVAILKKLGDLEKAQEITQAMIKLFEQLLASFQEGLSAKGEWINSLDRALNSMYASASQTLNKASQAA